MSAFFKAKAAPVLAFASAAALRAEPSALLFGTGAMPIGVLSTAGWGGNFFDLVFFDVISTQADDGTSVWKPNDLGVLDPGRWKVLGSESAVSTYVRRKLDGTIDGFAGGDLPGPVVRVNFDTDPNQPVPAVLCGLSVDRGAIAGVERDRAILAWDEANSVWHLSTSTADDTAITGPYRPLIAAGVYSRDYGASGFIRLDEDDAITAKVGLNTRNLAVVTAADVAAFGDTAADQATLDAGNDVTLTSRLADVNAHCAHLFVRDASGLSEVFDVSVPGGYAKVTGDLSAFNGVNPVFSVDVSAGIATMVDTLRLIDAGALATVDLKAASTPTTTDATATTVATIPVPASGSVGVLVHVKGTQSTGANGFQQLCINSARRSGAGAPTLSQGAGGIVIATLENTYAVTRPSFQFVISGNNLLLRVVGKVATTINWLPYYALISR